MGVDGGEEDMSSVGMDGKWMVCSGVVCVDHLTLTHCLLSGMRTSAGQVFTSLECLPSGSASILVLSMHSV